MQAAAVAAHYGFVDGADHVSVTASNNATCPAGADVAPPCYSVTISGVVPLFCPGSWATPVTRRSMVLPNRVPTSAAVAAQTTIQQPLCLLTLSQSGTGIPFQRRRIRILPAAVSCPIPRLPVMARTSKPITVWRPEPTPGAAQNKSPTYRSWLILIPDWRAIFWPIAAARVQTRIHRSRPKERSTTARKQSLVWQQVSQWLRTGVRRRAADRERCDYITG